MNKEDRARELRDEILRDIRELSPSIYDVPDYMKCEMCEESCGVDEVKETHDGYFLCPGCAEDYCKRCDACGILYDKTWEYCPICGAIK